MPGFAFTEGDSKVSPFLWRVDLRFYDFMEAEALKVPLFIPGILIALAGVAGCQTGPPRPAPVELVRVVVEGDVNAPGWHEVPHRCTREQFRKIVGGWKKLWPSSEVTLRIIDVYRPGAEGEFQYRAFERELSGNRPPTFEFQARDRVQVFSTVL